MSTLTIRLPDDKHLRLLKLAEHRAISVNKLMEELATISIAEFDAETLCQLAEDVTTASMKAMPATSSRTSDQLNATVACPRGTEYSTPDE